MAPKVFVTRKIHEDALRLLKNHYVLDVWDSDDVISRDELKKRVRGVDAILCVISDKIDSEILDAAGPLLKTVATMSNGTDHIDQSQCKKRGISISTAADVCTDAAAELTAMLVLVAARRCFEGLRACYNGEWGLWKPMWICGIQLSQRTLGILGFGRVGFGVARRLKPFGLKRIIYNDVTFATMGDDLGAEFVEKDVLYRESEILVITCPLNGMTHKMINRNVFNQMKKGAIIVNSSRGAIIETNDLVEALRSGQLMAAGLDVTDPEPLPADHPLVHMDNCIITPHMGTATVRSRKAMAIDAAENVIATLKYVG